VSRAQRVARLGLRLAVTLVLALGVVRVTAFTVYRVAGTSMLETLADGDRIMVFDPGFAAEWIETGDAVVLEVDGEVLVKRVAAGPGDRIAMRAGRVIRNGRPVAESIPAALRRGDSFGETRLAADEFFVLGDNRRVSVDSRDFGPVRRGQLLGKVVVRMPRTGGLRAVAALER